MRRNIFGIIVTCMFALMVASFQGVTAQDTTGVNGVRFGLKDGMTRFVVDTTEKIDPEIFLLSNPNRLVIDIPSGRWLSNKKTRTMGLVSQYRHGQFKPGVFRLVLDLNAGAVVHRVSYLPPAGGYGYRAIIDIKPANASTFAAAVAESKRKAAARKPVEREPDVSEQTASKRAKHRNPNGKRVIVIDPGHGGHDPGSLGSRGRNEETITLEIAKAMKAELEKENKFIVYLTRDTDRFIELRQRYKIAREKNADLFISVHADSIDTPSASGGTIYTLSETTSDRETAQLVRQQNAVDVLGGIDVEVESQEVLPILLDLAMREKMNASAQFAEILLPELRKTVNMRKHGHRFGPWIVLKDPIVPAVLLETGFISNKKDAQFISSKAGQQKIARAVRTATVQYFTQLAENGR